MKIDVLSDLHIDFYFRHHITIEAVESAYAHILTDNGNRETGDVLIIAGDIGHYNEQNIEVLKLIKQIFGYKHMICVLGNHDYYLISGGMRNAFSGDSLNRIKHMRDLINKEDGMYCLDGEIVEIGGVKFGGCDSWYDGSYAKKHFSDSTWKIAINDAHLDDLWKLIMNDANYITNMNWIEYAQKEKEKIEKIYQSVDVMITHVNPSIQKEHTSQNYREEKTTGFFTFDGSEYLKKGSMKYWVYGHTHIPAEHEIDGVKCICNPMGYPAENSYGENVRIKSFTLL